VCGGSWLRGKANAMLEARVREYLEEEARY
jgi:hypothetical protein